MQMHRLMGKTNQEIADLFKVSKNTVTTAVEYARQHDLVVSMAQQVMDQRLVSKAIAVYEYHLRRGNLDAARDVLYGTGVLSNTQKVKAAPQEQVAAAGETLEIYRERLIRRRETAPESPDPPAPVLIDAQPLPPAPASAGPADVSGSPGALDSGLPVAESTPSYVVEATDDASGESS
jgi:hypothetical protein